MQVRIVDKIAILVYYLIVDLLGICVILLLFLVVPLRLFSVTSTDQRHISSTFKFIYFTYLFNFSKPKFTKMVSNKIISKYLLLK